VTRRVTCLSLKATSVAKKADKRRIRLVISILLFYFGVSKGNNKEFQHNVHSIDVA